MDLLKKFEIEKKIYLFEKHNKALDYIDFDKSYKDGSLYFYCGICEKKCYEDKSSGINFYKKVILNVYDKTYSKFARIDKDGKMWMKVCNRCKYNNKNIGYCVKCDSYYMRDKLYERCLHKTL